MVTSATMKRLWADPEWRERQLERIAEGNAQGALAGRYVGAKPVEGHKVGRQIQLSARVDPEIFAALKERAAKQGKPVTELIRTYVEWGLEQEQQCQD